MPQRKYGTHTMSIRSKPYWITSGSDVYIESKGVPSKYAEQDIGVLFGGTNYLKLYFGQTGMEIEEIKFVCTQAF